MPLLPTAGTSKEKAGTTTYINVLPTCVTIVLPLVFEQPQIHNFMHQWVYLSDGDLVIFL